MPRKQQDLSERLEAAALVLFGERGYEATTSAQIAERAGVTQRTFFRTFADKQDVLFGREARVQEVLARSIGAAPAELPPLAALFHAFRAIAPDFEAVRDYALPRHQIIRAHPLLREREVAKAAALADALIAVLERRGADGLIATLAARSGVAALTDAMHRWFDDPSVAFVVRLDQAERAMKAMG